MIGKSTRKRIAIIDVDGTIADCSHRLHHIEKDEKDWDTFYNLAHYDAPLKDNIKKIKKLLKKNGLFPFFVTGRSNAIEWDTRDFIEKYFTKGKNYKLRMRKSEDRRSAADVKKEILHTLLKHYAVEMWFEDDLDCRNMYGKELKSYHAVGYVIDKEKGFLYFLPI